jgi:hypothetical protein
MPAGTRRPHNKSRLGCTQCKRRRIKVIIPWFLRPSGGSHERVIEALVVVGYITCDCQLLSRTLLILMGAMTRWKIYEFY